MDPNVRIARAEELKAEVVAIGEELVAQQKRSRELGARLDEIHKELTERLFVTEHAAEQELDG